MTAGQSSVLVTMFHMRHVLSGSRYPYSDERELCDAIDAVLREHYTDVAREVRLGAGGRVDFLVHRLAIEVKAARRWSRVAVLRQLQGYARSPDVDAIILVTDRAQLASLHGSIDGKPCAVLCLYGGLR